jgi:hypothetical protein
VGRMVPRKGSVSGAGDSPQPQPDQRRVSDCARQRPPREPQAQLDSLRPMGQGSTTTPSVHEVRGFTSGVGFGHALCPHPAPVRRSQRSRRVSDRHPRSGP